MAYCWLLPLSSSGCKRLPAVFTDLANLYTHARAHAHTLLYGNYSVDGCTHTVTTVCCIEEISRFQLIHWLNKLLTQCVLVQLTWHYKTRSLCTKWIKQNKWLHILYYSINKNTFCHCTAHNLWVKWIKSTIALSKHHGSLLKMLWYLGILVV